MKKAFIIILSVLFLSTPAFAEAKKLFNYDLEQDINRNNKPKQTQKATTKTKAASSKASTTNKASDKNVPTGAKGSDTNDWESQKSFYPDATMKSAIKKYKSRNYSGCLQELISLTKKDKSNPLVYYYLGMTYTQIGNKTQAINAYNKVLKLHPDYTLTTYATKGRNCLMGAPSCNDDDKPKDELDKFVNSPYGDGLSKQVYKQQRDLQLKNIQKKINKTELDADDINKIKKFDKKSEAPADERIADVSNEDVLAAIETLKKAGVTVSVNPYQTQYPMNDEYAQLSMMLGSTNNNNNNQMMNMLPMLMAQNNGKNIDPQILQSMMMNSMIPDFTFNDKKDY